MPHIILSRHATARAQQRGVTLTQVDAIVRYADMEILEEPDAPRSGSRGTSFSELGDQHPRESPPIGCTVSPCCKAATRPASRSFAIAGPDCIAAERGADDEPRQLHCTATIQPKK
jgi:hypothetical protein